MKSETRAVVPWARVCYGVDVSGTFTSVVRAERRGRQLRYEVLPFDATVISEMASEGTAVACGMPVGQGITSWLVAPLASIAKSRRVFPTLLDIQLPFPLEDCVYYFADACQMQSVWLPPATLKNHGGQAGRGVATLALAARRTDVEQRLSVLHERGIDPHVLDYDGVALWTQSLCEQPIAEVKQDTPLRVVMYMRDDNGLMVIGRGNAFWSAHRIATSDPLSVDRYLRAPLSQLQDLEAGPSLAVEWFWSGFGLGAGEAGAQLRGDLEQRWSGVSTTCQNPESFLARAFATRALLPGRLRTNLRGGALAHVGAHARMQGGRIRSATVLMVAGLLLCAASAAWNVTIRTRQSDLKQQFAKRINAAVGFPVGAKGSGAFLVAERELADRTKKRAPFLDAFSPSQVAALQQTLSVLNQQTIPVERFEMGSGILQIKGVLPSRAAESDLKDAISALGYRVDITSGDKNESGQFAFVLEATEEVAHEYQ